jgi:hypothetical protein
MSRTLSELAAASRNWIGDAPTGAMLGAMRAFLGEATGDEALLREGASSLHTFEPGSVAWIAVTFGTLVERGASAQITGPAVLGQLRAWLPSLPTPGDADAEPPVPTPGQAMRLSQFQFLCQSAVAHLARLPAMRQAMSEDAPLLERLDELRAYSYGAWWVHEALSKSSGTLVVLHAPSGTGLRLAYSNVSNCFHLFSLLQAAVGASIPGGREPDEIIAGVARGKGSDKVGDKAWWHYGNATSPTADLRASIWGEGNVRDIPRVAGEQVVLLWPPLVSRTWDAGFLGPHLEAMPADATVERVLTAEESSAWLAKLGIGRRRRRWWPF